MSVLPTSMDIIINVKVVYMVLSTTININSAHVLTILLVHHSDYIVYISYQFYDYSHNVAGILWGDKKMYISIQVLKS